MNATTFLHSEKTGVKKKTLGGGAQKVTGRGVAGHTEKLRLAEKKAERWWARYVPRVFERRGQFREVWV